MRAWLHMILTEAIAPPVVLVTVLRTAGSTPREAGAQMLVTRERILGSIGGGRLEFDEIAAARALIDGASRFTSWHRATRTTILGPDAGQCCGGSVETLHELIGAPEVPLLQALSTSPAIARPVRGGIAIAGHAGVVAFSVATAADETRVVEPVVRNAARVIIYGGGHIAAALQHALAPLPFDVAIHVDATTTATALVRATSPGSVPTSDLIDAAQRAPAGAVHLVMTHSHDLDYAICDVLLRRPDCAFVGLIGSATKRARFVRRFALAGLPDTALARLVCPIGLDTVAGKDPAVIAVSIAAQLLSMTSPP